jgi:hypothetical protein
VKFSRRHAAAAKRQRNGGQASCGRFSRRTGGSENRYALRASRSSSLIPVKDVYGKTGK